MEQINEDIKKAVQPHINGNIVEIVTVIAHQPPEGGLQATVVTCYDSPLEAKKALMVEAATMIN